MGFGDAPEKALTGPMQKLLDGGFIQSVRMIVDKLGFNVDPKVRSTQEIAVATAPIELADRRDRAGPGRRPKVPLGGARRRRGRRAGHRELVDG